MNVVVDESHSASEMYLSRRAYTLGSRHKKAKRRRSHKLLEEVLSKKNMILVYKSTSSVDNVANDEIKDKLKQGLTNHNLLKVLKFQSLVMVLENLV